MSISISGCAISSHNETISARAGHILTKAHDSYNRGHYLEALSQSETLYELDAFRTDNLLLLGAIHFQLRNFSESIFYNQQCIRVDPSFAESYSNLGNALKELGDLAAAAQFYLKVRNERVIHLVTSVEFFMLWKVREDYSFLYPRMRMQSHPLPLFYLSTRLFLSSVFIPFSIFFCVKAIKLKPKYSDAYNNLASTYMQLGRTQEATETYQMALVLNPSLVDAHSNLGNLRKAAGW